MDLVLVSGDAFLHPRAPAPRVSSTFPDSSVSASNTQSATFRREACSSHRRRPSARMSSACKEFAMSSCAGRFGWPAPRGTGSRPFRPDRVHLRVTCSRLSVSATGAFGSRSGRSQVAQGFSCFWQLSVANSMHRLHTRSDTRESKLPGRSPRAAELRNTTRAAVSSDSSRPGGKLSVAETDKLPAQVREAVLGAVEKLGGRVTVGDVAAAAGVKLTDADRALKALAADANGFLEVSDEGDVLYVFPKDARAVLTQNSLRVRFGPLLQKAKDAGSYLLRVSFGTALFVSIIVVYTAIAALLSAQSRDSDNRERGGYRGGYSSAPNFYINLSDFFWYWDPFYYQRLRMQLQSREMSFVESIFSFVFGDGDPNEGLDEARWKAVGELISSKGGVVTAEEVAPFLDLPNDYQENESYMLPVVQRFDGYPTVDSQGNILYSFPQLQRTAQDWMGKTKVLTGQAAMDPGYSFADLNLSPPASSRDTRGQFFAQNLWSFSVAPKYKQALAAGLGILNLVGVLYLSFLVRDPAILRQAGPDFVSGITSFLPLLQGYAATFFAIPAIRWLTQQTRNERILENNAKREDSALRLSRPPAQLKRKIANAREQAEKVVLDEERVIYSTAKDLSDQRLDEREWDKKFDRSQATQAPREERW